MKEKRLTRGEAIKAKCLECCCYQPQEVKLCHIKKCPLWPYRRGREVQTEDYPPKTARREKCDYARKKRAKN